jgi:hypothetical protein
MKLRLGAVSVLVAVSAGCAGSGQSSGDDEDPADPSSSSTSEQSSTPTSTPTSTAADTGPCALLAAATIRELAGEELAGEELEGQEGTVVGSDLPACIYGRLDGVGVQVAQVPASEWARALPALADQLEAADALGDPGIRRQLEEAAQLIESGRTIPSQRACGLFTDMLELLQGGVPPGADYSITYVPSDRDPQVAAVQACVDDTFTTVGVARPDLKAGAEMEAALEAALQEALASTTSS